MISWLTELSPNSSSHTFGRGEVSTRFDSVAAWIISFCASGRSQS